MSAVTYVRAGDPVEWGKPMGPSAGPRTWRPVVPHPDRPAAFADDFALVTCHRGHECMLSARVHRVAADGTVTPSCVCPVQGCDGHEFIVLGGWSPA